MLMDVLGDDELFKRFEGVMKLSMAFSLAVLVCVLTGIALVVLGSDKFEVDMTAFTVAAALLTVVDTVRRTVVRIMSARQSARKAEDDGGSSDASG